MRSCCHCGAGKSPCWRRGPPEKPLLCNACGAHYLVKKSLDGYMPGQRSSSLTTSSDSHNIVNKCSKQRRRQVAQLQEHDTTGSTASSSAGSSFEQESLEVDQPSVCSRKRSRLMASSVFQAEPWTESGLHCKRTFEAQDGCVVTVTRRMRKQLNPRASCST